jgi:threonyl-tRNA synthetase
LDFQLPERFGLKFTAQDGNEKQPVVIHRALLGSLERFIGIYIEHTGGAFPFWLAPEQAVLIPVNNDNHLDYAREVHALFTKKGFRVRLDDRNESLGYKTRQTQKGKIPFMIVIGDREMENKSLSIRAYGEMKAEDKPLDTVVSEFEKLAEMNIPAELKN